MAKSVLKDKKENSITWLEATIQALKILGRPAGIDDIYDVIVNDVVSEVPASAKTPKQTVYGQIYTHSQDSAAGKGDNIFYYSGEKGIWGLVDNRELPELDVGLSADDDEFPEGRAVLKIHLHRERNKELVDKAKKRFSKEHGGKLFCEICGFDFFSVYGECGRNFIEAHHIKPVAEMKENDKTKIEDLVMLCSNCHRMIHRIRPWIGNRDEIKKILVKKT